MQINFYDAKIMDSGITVLVKEKGVNYETNHINCPEKIFEIMQKLLHMGELVEEHCYMIAFNRSFKILGIFFLSKGTVCMSLVSPRELFLRAVLIGSAQVVFCHNHPSGNTTPSTSDRKLTKEIKEAGDLLNIPLTDHIIIGRDAYFSFKEQDML